MIIKNVIFQNPFTRNQVAAGKGKLHRSQLPDESEMILPACSARRVCCTEDGSVWLGSAFSAENTPLKEDNRLVFVFIRSSITKLMYCRSWLMGSVAYQALWSICEQCNSHTENYVSKNPRVVPWDLAFSAEEDYSLWAHIRQEHFLTAIRSHSSTIYSTSSSAEAFVPAALLPLFCFSVPALLPTNTNAWLFVYGWKSLAAKSPAYWLLKESMEYVLHMGGSDNVLNSTRTLNIVCVRHLIFM